MTLRAYRSHKNSTMSHRGNARVDAEDLTARAIRAWAARVQAGSTAHTCDDNQQNAYPFSWVDIGDADVLSSKYVNEDTQFWVYEDDLEKAWLRLQLQEEE